MARSSASFVYRPLCSRPIKRLVSLHRDAIAQPLVGEIIPHGMMHRGAVVPEGDRVGLPDEAALELRCLGMAIEHLEQRLALMTLETDDAGGEIAVHIKRLAPGYRMSAHHRMLVAWKAAGFGRVAEAAAIDLGAVMHGGEALAQPLDRRRERLVGAIHVGEQRVATAIGRQLLHVEDAA